MFDYIVGWDLREISDSTEETKRADTKRPQNEHRIHRLLDWFAVQFRSVRESAKNPDVLYTRGFRPIIGGSVRQLEDALVAAVKH